MAAAVPSASSARRPSSFFAGGSSRECSRSIAGRCPLRAEMPSAVAGTNRTSAGASPVCAGRRLTSGSWLRSLTSKPRCAAMPRKASAGRPMPSQIVSSAAPSCAWLRVTVPSARRTSVSSAATRSARGAFDAAGGRFRDQHVLHDAEMAAEARDEVGVPRTQDQREPDRRGRVGRRRRHRQRAGGHRQQFDARGFRHGLHLVEPLAQRPDEEHGPGLRARRARPRNPGPAPPGPARTRARPRAARCPPSPPAPPGGTFTSRAMSHFAGRPATAR